MKHVLGLISLGLALFSKPSSASFNVSPVVVVELFTSQGCSSCPAADDLLNEMIKRQATSDHSVLGLSFHVSYWNHLGWKDPYSSEMFTARQKKYADVLHLESIYTPQMIVNGTTEFVGSDRHILERAIALSIKKQPTYNIRARAILKGLEALISYEIDGTTDHKFLNIAMVQLSAENYVPNGENKGRMLRHFNVVRKFETVALQNAGDLKISFPSSLNPSQAQVILYIQDENSFEILGAIEMRLNP